MSDEGIDWRRRRSDLLMALKDVHGTDYEDHCWKLTFLYALHFADGAEPNFHMVNAMLEDEGPALMVVKQPQRVLELWQEVSANRANLMKWVLERLPAGRAPDRAAITTAKEELKLDLQLKLPPADASPDSVVKYQRFIWAQCQAVDALRFGDLQQAWLKDQPNVVMARS